MGGRNTDTYPDNFASEKGLDEEDIFDELWST
jgi:hypothetical protein